MEMVMDEHTRPYVFLTQEVGVQLRHIKKHN
jgi:hypothetical protein